MSDGGRCEQGVTNTRPSRPPGPSRHPCSRVLAHLAPLQLLALHENGQKQGELRGAADLGAGGHWAQVDKIDLQACRSRKGKRLDPRHSAKIEIQRKMLSARLQTHGHC